MWKSKTTVREFIAQDVDMDVYDDVTDELGIAFVGPMELTDEGKEHFAQVLDLEMMVKEAPGFGTNAYVLIDGTDGNGWKKRLKQAKEFFEAAAGYCSADDYDRWFKQ